MSNHPFNPSPAAPPPYSSAELVLLTGARPDELRGYTSKGYLHPIGQHAGPGGGGRNLYSARSAHALAFIRGALAYGVPLAVAANVAAHVEAGSAAQLRGWRLGVLEGRGPKRAASWRTVAPEDYAEGCSRVVQLDSLLAGAVLTVHARMPDVVNHRGRTPDVPKFTHLRRRA